MTGGDVVDVRISAKGRFVIPADIRKKYNLRPGDQVQVVDYGGVVALVPKTPHPVRDAGGRLAGGSSLVAALERERLAERKCGR